MQIASAKFRIARGASHQPAFEGSWLIISPTCLSYLSSRCRYAASPGILYPIMIGLMVVVLTFRLTLGEIFLTL